MPQPIFGLHSYEENFGVKAALGKLLFVIRERSERTGGVISLHGAPRAVDERHLFGQAQRQRRRRGTRRRRRFFAPLR